MLWKWSNQYVSKFEKLSSGHSTGKCQFHSSVREKQCKRMLKLPHSCTHLTGLQSNVQNSPSQVSAWLTNMVHHIVNIWFTNMWTMNFQMFKLDLEKAQEPEIKLPTSAGSSKKYESSRKTFISALLTMPKPLTVWITINCGKFWKRWEYQTTWPASWEICMQIRKQHLSLQ